MLSFYNKDFFWNDTFHFVICWNAINYRRLQCCITFYFVINDRSGQDQANIFTKHLGNTFQLHYNMVSSVSRDSFRIKDADNFFDPNLPILLPLRYFSPSEVDYQIKKITGLANKPFPNSIKNVWTTIKTYFIYS